MLHCEMGRQLSTVQAYFGGGRRLLGCVCLLIKSIAYSFVSFLAGMENYGRNMFNNKRSRVHYEGRSVCARNKYTGIQLSL